MTSTDVERHGGSLTIRDSQTGWSEQQLAVLRQTGIDGDVTEAELQTFLHYCQRTGLDPFARQIYLIGRWDSKAQRKVYRPQTAIDGFRLTGRRAANRSREAYGYEDTLWCGQDGQWRDVWLSRQPPAAAKVVVVRSGQRFPAIALYSEYCPMRNGKPDGLWPHRPAGQLAKCAEALALRAAFPADLSGIYTAEEMEQADTRDTAPASGGSNGQAGQVLQGQAEQVPTGGEGTPDPAVTAQTLAEQARDAATPDELQTVIDQADQHGPAVIKAQVTMGGRAGPLAAYVKRRRQQLTPQDDTQTSSDGDSDGEEPVDDAEAPATEQQLQQVAIRFNDCGVTDRDQRLRYVTALAGRHVDSMKHLTRGEADQIADTLRDTSGADDPTGTLDTLAGLQHEGTPA